MATDSLMVLLTVVLAVLTLIIAGLTLVMVFVVHKQWRVQHASEERSRERDMRRIKISYGAPRMGPTFSAEFAELTVANDGLVDVEIRLFAFEVGAHPRRAESRREGPWRGGGPHREGWIRRRQ